MGGEELCRGAHASCSREAGLAPPPTSTPSEQPPAVLVSSIVDTAQLPPPSSPGSSAIREPIVVTLPVIADDVLEHAWLNASTRLAQAMLCEQPSLFPRGAREASCVAGCCDGGRCYCRPGYIGRLCEFELRCTVATPTSSGFLPPSERACLTSRVSDRNVSCACFELGLTAVIRFRNVPHVRAAHALSSPPRLLPILRARLASRDPLCSAVQRADGAKRLQHV